MTPSTPSSEAGVVSQRPLAVASARVEPSWIVDGVLVALAVAFVAALVHYFARAVAPMTKTVAIDLAVAALPTYALLSLVRVVLSYVLSLIYTVLYGTIAAKNARAERVMIPLLDVLQGIPVLGFLPGVGLALIALFPASNVGIELTCVLMIFTAMPWNMAYSYYASLRTIPEEFAEVARVHRFTWWQRFTKLEFPIALNGLVWNSMMSVAGGWFFLLILEVFTLRNFATGVNESFVLPGLGSYMAEAYRLGRWDAVGYALATMAVIVVLTDRIFWKPIVAWAEQYRLDAPSEPRRTWIGALVARSHLVAFLRRLRSDAAARAHAVAESAPASEDARPWIPPRVASRIGTAVSVTRANSGRAAVDRERAADRVPGHRHLIPGGPRPSRRWVEPSATSSPSLALKLASPRPRSRPCAPAPQPPEFPFVSPSTNLPKCRCVAAGLPAASDVRTLGRGPRTYPKTGSSSITVSIVVPDRRKDTRGAVS